MRCAAVSRARRPRHVSRPGRRRPQPRPMRARLRREMGRRPGLSTFAHGPHARVRCSARPGRLNQRASVAPRHRAEATSIPTDHDDPPRVGSIATRRPVTPTAKRCPRHGRKMTMARARATRVVGRGDLRAGAPRRPRSYSTPLGVVDTAFVGRIRGEGAAEALGGLAVATAVFNFSFKLFNFRRGHGLSRRKSPPRRRKPRISTTPVWRQTRRRRERRRRRPCGAP